MAVVGILASLVGPAIELGKCIAEPIKRQYNYLCCFSSNIQNLRDEVKKLEDARTELGMRVTRAENNAEVIVPQVETWLKDVSEIQEKMSGIESEITNIQGGGCLVVKSRFSLTKKVVKTTEAMKHLREVCPKSNEPISHPPPPAAMVSIPLRSTYEFESRKHIEEDVMITLRDHERVNMLGICGMGGVGKTTMAKRVMSRVRDEDLIDETVMVVVSQQVDMLKIQKEIAESLGLRFEEESLSSRAHRLRTRLMGGKRILIILDDVWKSLKLEDLGIPCENGLKGCTILLTSRDRDVLHEMGAQKICEIQTLSEVEAWSLFKEKVGVWVDDQNLISIAQEITEECKGLPIALVTVGGALKNKRSKSLWEDARQQLKSSNPIDMPKILEDVYKPLKLSYDFLDNQHAKSMFLLCCLFPEDDDIPLEYLSVYAMGLGMLEEIRNLEQVRNRTYSLVEMLKSRFLLLESRDENHVRMHDVVRDVAIFIASKEMRLIKCGDDCTWISPFLGERIELSNGLIFSNLRLLLTDNSKDEKLQISHNFFQGMTKLNVLSMRYYSLSSLPHTTQLLKNLQTLILYECRWLKTISVVGELVSLEILICRKCESIEELPLEIGRLDRLKLLEFSRCWQLKKVAPGMISSLVGLEELKMVGSFDKWEAEDNEGKERKNARLSELSSLSNLTCLKIEIKDFTLASQSISLPSKIMKYHIKIGDGLFYTGGPFYTEPISKGGFEKKMELCLPREITLGNWIHECLRSVEYMRLQGDGSTNLELEQAQNTRSLTLRECSTVKKLVNITSSSIDDGRCCSTTTTTIFPRLESLWLHNLANLEEICDIDGSISEGSSIDAFNNLKELRLQHLPALKHNHAVSHCSNLSSIVIDRCGSLRNLFSLATSNACLLQLEILHISSCEMMEQVFLWNIEEEIQKDIEPKNHQISIIFPKLKVLTLWYLPRLSTFCKGIESIEFPMLTDMRIDECPHLKSFVSTSSSIGSGNNNQNNFGGISHNHDDEDEDDHSLHLFCKPEKVAFGSLKLVWISGYEENSSSDTLVLWCHQVPIGLEELCIEDCGNIRSLFSSSIAQNLVNLKKLKIERCEKMEKVIEDDDGERDGCEMSTISLFPSLQQLEIWELPKLEIVRRCALIEFPSLKDVHIFGCPKMERFSLGTLTAPNLKTIRMGFRDITIDTDQDLNGALQHHLFRAKEEESFYKWVAKVKGIKRMSDLQFDFRTDCLELQIKDSTLAAEQIRLPSDIVKYHITIGNPNWNSGLFSWRFDKTLRLQLPREITLGNWIHQCVRSVEHMWLEGEGANNVDLGQAQNMRAFTLAYCSTVKQLVAEDCLLQLQHLEIGRCNMMEQVFLWNEEENQRDIGVEHRQITIIFPKLKTLKLSNLPRLTTFSKGIERMEFPLLNDLQIEDCPQLKSLVSATSSAESIESIEFPLLTKMTINNCPQLKSFVSVTNQNNSGGMSHDHDDDDDSLHLFCKPEKVAFGSLKELHILGYENISKSDTLILWCHQIPPGFFTGIEKLCIKDCGNIRSLFSSSISGNLVNLKNLRIERCKKMVKVIEDGDKEKDATANNCLLQLERLEILDCPMMEQVLPWKEDENKKLHDLGQSRRHCRITFPKLKNLELYHLPRLTTFCKGIQSIDFPLLTRMGIRACPNLKSLVSTTTSSSSGGINHDDDDDDSLHLFCKPKDEFGRLKELWIGGCENISSSTNTLTLWCDKIPTHDFFTGLEELDIFDFSNIMSLFSSSIARSLVKLQKLKISGCGEMVKVIEDEDGEKDACEMSTICLFPRLQRLVIWELPKLEIFCEWRSCALIELSSLKDVYIADCPKMKRFNLGSLTTPNLETITMDYEDFFYTTDLNVILQEHVFRVEGGWENDETAEKAAEREAMEEVRGRGDLFSGEKQYLFPFLA